MAIAPPARTGATGGPSRADGDADGDVPEASGEGPGAGGSGMTVEGFVTASWPRLYRTAYLMTGNRQEAEDAVQSALASVVERWDRIRRRDDPEVYARRVVATTIWRRGRRRRLELARLALMWHRDTAGSPGRAGGRGSPDPGSDIALRDEIVAALQQLPARMRAAVLLRHYADMSETEAAEALGCSVGTVKSQTSRGLGRLRDLLATNREADEEER